MMPTVYRVQDAEGRGPWRPGFSKNWVEDRADHDNLPPWMVEFGDVRREMIFGMYLGCGCRTLEQLQRWFTPSEYAKLRGYGYRAVKMDAVRILAESDVQLVFERATPLRLQAEPVELYDVSAPVAGPGERG